MPTTPGPPSLMQIRWSDSPEWAASLLDALDHRLVDKAPWGTAGLAALSESIDTRFRVLEFLGRSISGLLAEIATYQKPSAPGETHIVWPDADRIRSLLGSSTAFLSESRACFYNLAHVCRLCRRHFCGDLVSMKESYALLAELSGEESAMGTLKDLRDLVQHYCAPTLLLRREQPGNEHSPLVLVLQMTTWRNDALAGTEDLNFGALLRIGERLKTAAAAYVRT